MRPINELINLSEPAWTFVKQWIDSADNTVEVLSTDTISAKEALFHIQVTTRSPMGAIVYMTGGLLIDNGWIRILGSGNEKLNRTLPDWNRGKTFTDFGEPPPFLFIADDVIGGFFLLNGGGLGPDIGKVYYWSPENLEYEPLNITYTEFLDFCFNGNLEEFYDGYRWTTWKTDIVTLTGDEVFFFFPFLWTKEGENIEENTRKIVPIEEQYTLSLDFRKQLGLKDSQTK
jgi:hypothetical protein